MDRGTKLSYQEAREAIEELGRGFHLYRPGRRRTVFCVDIGDNEVDFDDLEAISESLETKQINIQFEGGGRLSEMTPLPDKVTIFITRDPDYRKP